MFITYKQRGYTRDGQQVARGRFLVLCQLKHKPSEWVFGGGPIRAFVINNVRMEQCGHFMMASPIYKGYKLSLSGAYGNDGGPLSVDKELYDKAVPLPQELYDAWNKGGGWNGAGSEAPAMAEWALKTFPVRGKHGQAT